MHHLHQAQVEGVAWNARPSSGRSKDFPYGVRGLADTDKGWRNVGTILMARTLGMVEAIYKADRQDRVPGFATVENPPPSDHPQHLSAWHMPEMFAHS